MWAVLVVDILNKEFRGGRIFAVRARLREIPAKLSDLFKDILRRDGTNMNDLLLCLQWILFARRPLRREEFYFAMVAGLDPSYENMAEWNSEQVTVDDMNHFVLNSSKGLAELTKSKAPTVQFIHESVRDFLVKDDGLCEVSPELGDDFYSISQDELKRCCENYLSVDVPAYVLPNTSSKSSCESAKDLRQALATRSPFLEYASRYILYHAEEAAARIPQNDFLERLSIERLVNVSNLFARYDIRRHTSNASLLYLLAEYGFARLIRTVSHSGPVIGVLGERYHYPLFAALANGHREAVAALLHNRGNWLAQLEFGKAFSARKGQTPLFWALERRHEALAEILVGCRDVHLNSSDSAGRTALSFAAENGCESMISLLLETHGVYVNAIDKKGRAPLSYAAQQGQTNVVRRLLGGGASVKARDHDGYTALHWAAVNGHEKVVQELLLEGGANIEHAVDLYRNTALHRAAASGHTTTVGKLLDGGANVIAAGSRGYTALHWAADYGHDTTVQLLLSNGANVEALNSDGNTAVLLAAVNEHITTVQLLLDEGASIEAVNNAAETALLRAAIHGRKAMLQLLLERGANTEVRDQDGRTPLSYAAEVRAEHSLRLLLARNANVNAADKTGRTPLLWLVGQYRHTDSDQPAKVEAIVKLMLERGASVGTTDDLGKTAVQWAAARGMEGIVQLLEERLTQHGCR